MGRKAPKHADTPFFFGHVFYQRLTFNLRPNLEVNDYCESLNQANAIMEASSLHIT